MELRKENRQVGEGGTQGPVTVKNSDGKERERTCFLVRKLVNFLVPLNRILPSDSRPFKSFAGKCFCPVPLL